MNSNYFSHDSNARNDEKLVRLRMKHHAAGYGVYFMLLERMRETSSYMCVKDYNMIAFDLREDAGLIKSVVEEFGLFVFTDDGKYFYSESFLRRMRKMDATSEKRSLAGKKAMQSRWGKNDSLEAADDCPAQQPADNENITTLSSDDNNVITTLSSDDNNKNKINKRKENKENIECVRDAHAHTQKLLSFLDFREWLERYAPDLLSLRQPTEEEWSEVKCIYGSLPALKKACREVAANEPFRQKWKYLSVALKKWHEHEQRIKNNR